MRAFLIGSEVTLLQEDCFDRVRDSIWKLFSNFGGGMHTSRGGMHTFLPWGCLKLFRNCLKLLNIAKNFPHSFLQTFPQFAERAQPRAERLIAIAENCYN